MTEIGITRESYLRIFLPMSPASEPKILSPKTLSALANPLSCFEYPEKVSTYPAAQNLLAGPLEICQ